MLTSKRHYNTTSVLSVFCLKQTAVYSKGMNVRRRSSTENIHQTALQRLWFDEFLHCFEMWRSNLQTGRKIPPCSFSSVLSMKQREIYSKDVMLGVSLAEVITWEENFKVQYEVSSPPLGKHSVLFKQISKLEIMVVWCASSKHNLESRTLRSKEEGFRKVFLFQSGLQIGQPEELYYKCHILVYKNQGTVNDVNLVWHGLIFLKITE